MEKYIHIYKITSYTNKLHEHFTFIQQLKEAQKAKREAQPEA